MKLKIAIGILLLVGVIVGVYVFTSKQVAAPVTTVEKPEKVQATSTPVLSKLVAHDISWKIIETETNAYGTPHAEISVTIDGVEKVVGTYPGICHEMTASGGIDGTGLVEGELAAVQCYWAGGGDEIGVFENGTGTVIKIGEMNEGTSQTLFFRGNFKAI